MSADRVPLRPNAEQYVPAPRRPGLRAVSEPAGQVERRWCTDDRAVTARPGTQLWVHVDDGSTCDHEATFVPVTE